jgi:uncharacterized integral membrane protein
MKLTLSILISSLVAAWVAAIAVLSVQNATLVSLQFLTFESIKMPIGVVLAFSAALGIVGGAIAQAVIVGGGGDRDHSDF